MALLCALHMVFKGWFFLSLALLVLVTGAFAAALSNRNQVNGPMGETDKLQ
jgi:hypothetical protein